MTRCPYCGSLILPTTPTIWSHRAKRWCHLFCLATSEHIDDAFDDMVDDILSDCGIQTPSHSEPLRPGYRTPTGDFVPTDDGYERELLEPMGLLDKWKGVE